MREEQERERERKIIFRRRKDTQTHAGRQEDVDATASSGVLSLCQSVCERVCEGREAGDRIDVSSLLLSPCVACKIPICSFFLFSLSLSLPFVDCQSRETLALLSLSQSGKGKRLERESWSKSSRNDVQIPFPFSSLLSIRLSLSLSLKRESDSNRPKAAEGATETASAHMETSLAHTLFVSSVPFPSADLTLSRFSSSKSCSCLPVCLS